MNRKKIIQILSAILLIAIIVLLYFAFIRKAPVPTTSSGASGPTFGGSGSSGFTSNTPAKKVVGGASSTPSESVIPRLRHLTDVPTSGDIILTKQADVIKDRVKVKETEYFVRYIDRATGHIFDIKTDSPAALEISNTTIPKIYEAVFAPDGNSLIARLLSEANPDQILTYHIALKDKKLSASATSSKQTVNDIGILSKAGLKDVSGTYLPPDIKEFSLSPSGAKALTLSYTSSGSKLVSSGPNGAGAKTVLTHPLREWLISLISDSQAIVTTKPSGIANGYSYLLNLSTGSLKKIMGEIAGLTVLPNKDGNTYLGAGAPGGVIRTFVYFAKEDKRTILPFATFPEKCVWSSVKFIAYCAVPEAIPESTYPDAWYQGRVSFTDSLWKINVSTGETNLISDLPKESGQKIDAVNLELAGDDSYLTFTNKIDLTLWGLKLSL